jgi:hypothetical protein
MGHDEMRTNCCYNTAQCQLLLTLLHGAIWLSHYCMRLIVADLEIQLSTDLIFIQF